MFKSLLPFLCFVATATVVGDLAFAANDRRPNIILVMADDLGYETIGANGGESYATPCLDKLARDGMRFDRCHVQPLCTPTRVQLMTGLYNVRNYALFGAIDPQSVTFAHLLQEAGYVTGIAGKWQLGRGKKLPQRLGFAESCLWQHTRRPPRFVNPGLEYNGEARDFANGEYGPKLINDFAIDFVTRHRDRPFLLYYPMILTHNPFLPTPDSPEWNPDARGERDGQNVKHFADMVEYMDKMIGRLVETLDRLNIRQQTLIIFLGDNGTGRSVTSRFRGQDYPGGKGLTNARGTHVPMIANWPGKIPAGSGNGDLIDSTDFFPTICEAAGIDVPDTLALDGRSFLPQLLGDRGKPREWIYCWYARDGGDRASHEFAMNKELKRYRDGRLYDLAVDPYEEVPLRLAELPARHTEAAAMLGEVLGRFADARPAKIRASTPVVTKRSGSKARRRN